MLKLIMGLMDIRLMCLPTLPSSQRLSIVSCQALWGVSKPAVNEHVENEQFRFLSPLKQPWHETDFPMHQESRFVSCACAFHVVLLCFYCCCIVFSLTCFLAALSKDTSCYMLRVRVVDASRFHPLGFCDREGSRVRFRVEVMVDQLSSLFWVVLA